MKDTIAEMTYGAGAVRLDGKWIFRDMGVDTFKGRRVRVTVMAGLVATHEDQYICEHKNPDCKPGDDFRQEELWLGRVIVVPSDRYHSTLCKGNDINGMFTSGLFNPQGWTRSRL